MVAERLSRKGVMPMAPIGPVAFLMSGLIVSIVVIDDLLKRVSPPPRKCPRCGRPLKYHRGY